MRFIIQLFIALCIMALPIAANAHGYWLEADGDHKAKEAVTVKVYYGDYTAGERLNGKFLDRMKDIKLFVVSPAGEKQQVTTKQLPDYWEATFTPSADGIYEIIGLNDEREVQDWTKHNLSITRPIQYLKLLYPVGKVTSKPAKPQFLDITATKKTRSIYEVNVTKDNSPLAAQRITLASYGGAAKELVTDANGTASFSAEKDGLYILNVEWIDKTPGTFMEKPYETVRHRLDMSLYQ